MDLIDAAESVLESAGSAFKNGTAGIFTFVDTLDLMDLQAAVDTYRRMEADAVLAQERTHDRRVAESAGYEVVMTSMMLGEGVAK